MMQLFGNDQRSAVVLNCLYGIASLFHRQPKITKPVALQLTIPKYPCDLKCGAAILHSLCGLAQLVVS